MHLAALYLLWTLYRTQPHAPPPYRTRIYASAAHLEALTHLTHACLAHGSTHSDALAIIKSLTVEHAWVAGIHQGTLAVPTDPDPVLNSDLDLDLDPDPISYHKAARTTSHAHAVSRLPQLHPALHAAARMVGRDLTDRRRHHHHKLKHDHVHDPDPDPDPNPTTTTNPNHVHVHDEADYDDDDRGISASLVPSIRDIERSLRAYIQKRRLAIWGPTTAAAAVVSGEPAWPPLPWRGKVDVATPVRAQVLLEQLRRVGGSVRARHGYRTVIHDVEIHPVGRVGGAPEAEADADAEAEAEAEAARKAAEEEEAARVAAAAEALAWFGMADMCVS